MYYYMSVRQLREFINATLSEGSNEPDYHVMRTLHKHRLEDMRDVVSRWTMLEPRSPGSLKKLFIGEYGEVDTDDIDLKDPTTWGPWTQDDPDMPSDEFFVELMKAILADDKRAQQRPRDSHYDISRD